MAYRIHQSGSDDRAAWSCREGGLGITPMGRLAHAEEMAALAKYLASRDAGYITGANFHINGGLHIG